ncbi:lipase family protein [Nocardioides donggukensis]|uniref:Alpha/beta hydrolase n=1 Tax=Nocardioides donggukensis TaxID=2774019 RepID=A0A927K4R1_9ACTN|nr:hypothetical protein [Nocardioides donggukensis]MBD8868913.1 hypothetical protein [Nocardioides donggukensis]
MPVLDPVAVRVSGRAVGLDPESVGRAFPHAGGRLLVLLPPPGEDEGAWSRGPGAATYAHQLARLLDWTPVHLRVADAAPGSAGAAVSAALQRLVESWPVEVDRIALLGHGAGGLVLRAAAGVRPTSTGGWTARVSDVVLLGTPYLAAAAPRLATPVGVRVDRRWGPITTPDRADPGLAPLDGARYRLVTARDSAPRLLGRVLGGLLWWRSTLTRRPRRADHLFPTAEHYDLDTGGAPLTGHPEVAAALLDWLA